MLYHLHGTPVIMRIQEIIMYRLRAVALCSMFFSATASPQAALVTTAGGQEEPGKQVGMPREAVTTMVPPDRTGGGRAPIDETRPVLPHREPYDTGTRAYPARRSAGLGYPHRAPALSRPYAGGRGYGRGRYGHGAGYPGYRGHGGSAYPQHRQHGNPPFSPARKPGAEPGTVRE